MTELGKAAKHAGHQHPRVLRQIDPVPLRPTPAAKPHRKVAKPFGFSYEERIWWRKFTGCDKKWDRRYQWFKSAAGRDQAMKSFQHRHSEDVTWYRDIRAELRTNVMG